MPRDFEVMAQPVSAIPSTEDLARLAASIGDRIRPLKCVIQAIVGTHFRASWAAISEERGQAFHAIVGAPATG
jgi:hypothetical protein